MSWTAAPGILLAAALLVGGAVPVHGQEPVILAFGDSLTAGFGVRPEDAYPALLQARLRAAGYPHRVVNAGVSGDTTAGGLRRVDWALKVQPAIVILAIGANDGLRGQPVTSIQSNLELLVRRFQATGAQVLLAGMRLPPNYGLYAQQFERAYAEVARRTGAPFMPFFLAGVGGDDRLNQLDGIHPTAEGYRRVVERLWPHLEPLLAGSSPVRSRASSLPPRMRGGLMRAQFGPTMSEQLGRVSTATQGDS
jgi:acyl-CoA thioesterase I